MRLNVFFYRLRCLACEDGRSKKEDGKPGEIFAEYAEERWKKNLLTCKVVRTRAINGLQRLKSDEFGGTARRADGQGNEAISHSEPAKGESEPDRGFDSEWVAYIAGPFRLCLDWYTAERSVVLRG